MTLARRAWKGARYLHNWTQLAKFGVVGGSGYVVNLLTFALVHEMVGAHHLIAATVAFCVAVMNNLHWNRRWTFRGSVGRLHQQVTRFFTVSIGAFVASLAVLEMLVRTTSMDELPAQAVAIVVVTPISFIGNKLWTF